MSEAIDIHRLYLSEGHDFKGRYGKGRLSHGVRAVDEVECVAGNGLVGDRYFGYADDYKGQVSFIALEAIRELGDKLGAPIDDLSRFRRNVVVSGVDLNALVGVAFEIDGLRFYGTEQCKPCFWMNESIGEGALAAMKERGGLRCRILRSGTLKRGAAKLTRVD